MCNNMPHFLVDLNQNAYLSIHEQIWYRMLQNKNGSHSWVYFAHTDVPWVSHQLEIQHCGEPTSLRLGVWLYYQIQSKWMSQPPTHETKTLFLYNSITHRAQFTWTDPRAVNWDSRVLGLTGPGRTRESGSTLMDPRDSPGDSFSSCNFKAEDLLYRTRESTGTRESKQGESTSPKSWTPSRSNRYHEIMWPVL